MDDFRKQVWNRFITFRVLYGEKMNISFEEFWNEFLVRYNGLEGPPSDLFYDEVYKSIEQRVAQ